AVSSVAPAIILVGALGVGSILVQVNSVTLVQRSTDNELLGRVFAVLESLILGALAIGSLVTPGIVSLLGSRGAVIAVGLSTTVLLIPLWPALKRVDAEAVIAEEPLQLLRKIEIFAELPEQVLERLAAGATSISVAAEGVVVSRGEVGNHFYAIAGGKAVVERDDGTTRGPGPREVFGQVSALRHVRRTATR